MIEPRPATSDLAETHDAVKVPDGRTENLYLAMSQTPRAIEPVNDHNLAELCGPDDPLDARLTAFVSSNDDGFCGCEYTVASSEPSASTK